MDIMNLIIHNSFHDTTPSHTGDAILSRPIITTIRNTFSDLNIILQFEKKHHYFLGDLGISLTERHPITGPNFNAWFGVYTDVLNVHGLSYFTHVHSFNRQMEGQGLPYRLTIPDIHPMLQFPPFQGPEGAVPHGIFIENGPSLSYQNFLDMNLVIPRLVSDFKQHIFYVSAVPPIHNAPNLCNCQDKNLLVFHHISNQCCALITRGSGVNAATYSEENRNKPRAIVGWNYPYRLWDHRFTNCSTYEQLCAFVNSVKAR
jgi:hypothetical protein